MEKKWAIVDHVEIKKGMLCVSTAQFEEFYETMIFGEEGIRLASPPMWRYQTQEQAEAGHKKIVEALEKELYHLVPAEYYLELDPNIKV